MRPSRTIHGAGTGAWREWILALCLPLAFVGGPSPVSRADDPDEVRAAPAIQPGSTHNDGDEVRRQMVMCGPNSLYMLLAFHDVPVDSGAIEKYVPTHREGMSLAELQEASNALGLRTEVRRCSIDELRDSFQSPVIGYLLGPPRHYVVVIAMTEDGVTILDGTTGQRNTVPSPWLKERWSGYVLIPIPGRSIYWVSVAMSLIAWMLMLGWLFAHGKVSRSKGR
jgi:predicted double-glycine peptidase